MTKTPSTKISAGRWALFAIFGAALLIVMCSVANGMTSNPSTTVPAPGSTIDLRGDRFLLLRNVSSAPYYGLGVHLDRAASLFPYPQRPGVITYVTEAEWNAILLLREQWCTNQIAFSEPQPNESYYDFGVRCGDNSYQVKQGKIAFSQAPLVLEELRDRLEASQAIK
jgi:hypothetical protein